MQKHDMLNIASYSCYFKYLGLSRNAAKVLQVYSAIQDKSTRVHVSVCNSVLGCLVKNGRSDSTFKLYDEMIRGGLSPDLFTYSTVRDFELHLPYYHLLWALCNIISLE
jgi:pentatricopeptide repeat protein